MSSNFHATKFEASACIDGDVHSLCATERQLNAWASVKVPPGSTIDRVVIHNRPDDNKEFLAWLSPFEIWLGRDYGDSSTDSAIRCGGPSIHVPVATGPFTVSCDGHGARGHNFVTILHVGKARWLTIAEISVYGRPPTGWSPPVEESGLSSLSVLEISKKNAKPGTAIAHTAIGGAVHGASHHSLASPIQASASCRSVTMSWAASGDASQRYALFYAPTSVPLSERAWSTGLHEARATVTGLQSGVEYYFVVAAVSEDGTSNRRSPKLITRTPTKCEVPKGPRDPSCHAGTAKEAHRLGVPQVNALSCSALVLELPPLPPDHCDEDPNQRLAIEAKHGTAPPGSNWYEIKHNVLSSTLILGDLSPHVAYEFRMVLHRPQLGDRRSESTGLVVVEEPSLGNATGLRAAPVVVAEVRGGISVFVITWADHGAGICRASQPFAVELADARSAATRTSEAWPGVEGFAWHRLAANVTTGSMVLQADEVSSVCSSWCTFRLVPLGVDGWLEPTTPSLPVQVLHWEPPALRLLKLLCLALFGFVASFIAHAAYTDPALRDVRDAETRQRLWAVAQGAMRGALLEASSSVFENADWLSRAWLDGLGAYRRAAREDDVEDDGEDEDEDEDEDEKEGKLPLDGEAAVVTRSTKSSLGAGGSDDATSAALPTLPSAKAPLQNGSVGESGLGTDDFAPLLPPPPPHSTGTARAKASVTTTKEAAATHLEGGVLALDSPESSGDAGVEDGGEAGLTRL